MAISARRAQASLLREANAVVDEQPEWPASSVKVRRHRRRVAAPFATMNSMDERSKAEPSTPNPVMDLARKNKKQEAPPPPPPQPPAAWKVICGNLASGAIAGCVVEAALYPLDTIKTRLQMMRSGGGLSALLKQGGGKALYAGIGGNLLGVAPATAIFMAVYEPAKRALAAEYNPQTAFLASAALAGWAASLVRVPTEVVKQRIQAGEFSKPGQAVRTIVARDGIRRGMFAGYGAFLLRDLPFDAIEFWAFDTLNMRLKEVVKRELNPVEHAVCGAIAGAITGFTTTPLDVLKTRLMTQGSGSARVYNNVWHCAVKVYQEEGARAFLRGWQPRVTWIAIGGCIFFTALEQAKRLLVPPIPGDSSAAIKH